MIERTIVSVGGPPGSGKTTFVECLLRATDRSVQAVRCHRGDGVGSVGWSHERSERWEITEPYRGIELAQLVVINIRGDAERRRGERASEDVLRLRKDTQVFEDIFGWRGNRVPIKATVADLSNERDPGLKGAVRRVLRAFDR